MKRTLCALGAALGLLVSAAAAQPAGSTRLLEQKDGVFDKYGWNHYGPGGFDIDPKTGVATGRGGMGLLWYSAKKFRDFVLELDYMCPARDTNSGVFLRIPDVPSSDDYIYHAIEIQIYDAGDGLHATGSAYDIKAAEPGAGGPPGTWNRMSVTFKGRRLSVRINGRAVLDWDAVPGGKVRDLAPEGFIGLQNHDGKFPPSFRNICIKEL